LCLPSIIVGVEPTPKYQFAILQDENVLQDSGRFGALA
jgi:hypothetical protein